MDPPPQLRQDRNWLELPQDVTASILMRLGAIDILNSAQRVCTTWRSICKDPSMWRSIDMKNLGDLWDMPYDLKKMCMHAVDRSCGDLLDINIEYFGTNDLLDYIANRSSHLKQLRLVSCYNISDEGLVEAAKKFPLLEDLEISYCKLSNEPLEVVGRCCPRLKSLKVNCQGYKHPHVECNEEALTIAENMPHLHYLQLFGNKLTNEGLQAILDGCPQLESLDLRQCFNINLEGPLGQRCAEQIKDLRRPYDPTDDYPFDSETPDIGSSEEDYPSGFSDIDMMSDYDDIYEFSTDSDMYDFGDLYFDY